ncbi:hypothetical protein FRC11_012519 [Ceratobasidium sp. 423]|nr:hypothetical protein FRC11_012519 [Ceratobasidium sp. 423]
MGKPAAVPVLLAPVPQNLVDEAPNVPLSEALSTSLPSQPSIPRTLSEGNADRNGNPGHPTRSETNTPVSDRTSTTSPSLHLRSGVADVVPSVEPSRVPVPSAPQDSTAASPPTRALSNRPAGAFLIRGAHALVTTLKPLVKVCVLCTGAGVPILPDTGLILQSLDGVQNVDPEHTIIRTTKRIGTTLDEFFDPTDIREGAILILIGAQPAFIAFVQMLQDKIMALPEHCTLEAVVDTCLAEGVIPGLRRISTVDPSAPCVMPAGIPDSAATYTPPSGSRLNTKVPASSVSSNIEPCASFPIAGSLKHALRFFEGNQPQYKAQVVVWAASTRSANVNVNSYPEEDLPGRPGVYSILIGAIFKHFSWNGPNITRREVWENVLKVVEEHNNARHQRDLRKSLEAQAGLIKEDRIQRPILLTSVDDPDRVLSGLVFQPIKRM